jgi:hypothetical protein
MRDILREPTLNSEPESEEYTVRADAEANESVLEGRVEDNRSRMFNLSLTRFRVSQQCVVLVSHLFFFMLSDPSTK